MYYDSERIYIECATTLKQKIARIDQCIDALLTSVLTSMGKAGTQEYMLNDGQTTIKKIYRSPAEVTNAINSLDFIKARYISQLNGRAVKMVDAKNFYPRRR